jgi:hypothetical protein
MDFSSENRNISEEFKAGIMIAFYIHNLNSQYLIERLILHSRTSAKYGKTEIHVGCRQLIVEDRLNSIAFPVLIHYPTQGTLKTGEIRRHRMYYSLVRACEKSLKLICALRFVGTPISNSLTEMYQISAAMNSKGINRD